LSALPGYGPIPSKIMLVGEAWGKNEQEEFYKTGISKPFVGASGQELDRMLLEAGLSRSQCYTTNLINDRPPNNQMELWIPQKQKEITPAHSISLRDKKVTPNIVEGYQSLMFEIDNVKPNVIVALGQYAMWALTGIWGIQKWRGSELRVERPSRELQPVVVPTHHPARVLREWSLRAELVQDLRRATKFLSTREIAKPGWSFTLRPSFFTATTILLQLLDLVEAGDLWLEVDLETRRGHIACCGLSWSRVEALSIPFMCVERADGYWNEEEEAQIIRLLYRLLTHKNIRVRWQNGLYDAQYIYRHWHFIPRHAQDTMISQHILFPGLRKALDYQASFYNESYRYWKDDGKEWDKSMGEDQLWSYNCEDCVRTRECGEVENAIVCSMELSEQHSFHQRLFNPVLKAVNRGVRVDDAAKRRLDEELSLEISRREDFFKQLLGHELDPQSPKQMMALFYDDLQMRPIHRRRAGGVYTPSMDDEAIEELKQREPILRPLFRAIQEHRSLNVFRSTFVRAAIDFDGRLRCDFKICGTETYRFSSTKNVFGSGNNMQNIPKGGDDQIEGSDLKLPNVRKLYVPDEGMECFDTDLSKADLRIVVWEADEGEMKAMLAEGRDPYIETAREYYRDPTISKYNADGSENIKYDRFKRFSHGSHYLGTPQGLSKRIGLLVHEVERAQKWYFGKYPKIKAWQDKVMWQVRQEHQVSNIWGYRRHYFDRVDDSLFRQAIAWIPQSTIAILIDKIWMNLYDTAPMVEVLLQVHDSLFGQYPVDLRDKCVADIRRCSAVPLPYPDPLTIPVGVKTSLVSWGDCK